MAIQSRNPSTNEVINTFDEMSIEEVDIIIRNAEEAFHGWENTHFSERSELFYALADYFENEKSHLATIMATEMGKPITEGIAEVEKSAWACRYFADNAERLLKDEDANVDSDESYISFEPLGVILAVMPWNFPIWQVIRFAAPALMAGNVGVLKHASNVPQITLEIEKAFIEVGFPDGVFQSLLIGSSKVEAAINHKFVKAVSLTGGEIAGQEVASEAGMALKKCVLELGGNDSFIVLEDADLDKAVEAAVVARTINGGQSCIAAKRFIVHEYLYDEFTTRLATQFETLLVGDPLNESTQIGPLATESALIKIEEQVSKSIQMGAKVVTGAKRLNLGGSFYAPTVLTEVTNAMPVFKEETFGPVAAIVRVSSKEEAIDVANDSQFGLGASIWTQDIEAVKQLAKRLDVGAVFVNGIVKSDPRMPFGGIKKSGYGRELGSYGIKEFVNIKSVIFQKS